MARRLRLSWTESVLDRSSDVSLVKGIPQPMKKCPQVKVSEEFDDI